MSQSGLVRNTDFASDLMLNKIMSNELRTNNGKTLTLAGRVNAEKLDTAARGFNVLAENVRKGVIMAEGAADVLSEVIDIAKRASDANQTLTGDDLKSAATELQTALSGLPTTKIDGKTVLTAAVNVDMGLGSGNIAVGLDLASDAAYTKLTTALTSMVGGTAAGQSDIDDAISGLLTLVTNETNKAAILENRYNALNDMSASYKRASDDQVVTAGGNSTSLLNTLLG